MASQKDKKPKVAVIGAGLGGLACAVRLAHAGFSVVVYEKNDSIGGRIHEIQDGGHTWDTGPATLTMPQELEELWRSVDRDLKDYLTLVPLENTCRHHWTDGTVIDEDAAFRERKDVTHFLDYSRKLYEAAGDFFIHNSPRNWWKRFSVEDLQRLRHLPKFTTRRTMHGVVSSYFKDAHMAQIFDWFATWQGSSPYKMPSVFNFLPWLPAKYGSWHVAGGTRRIIEALERLAGEFDVEIRLQKEITGLHQNSNGYAVAINGLWEEADYVVCNQDAIESYQSFMPRGPAAIFRKKQLERLPLACSKFVICLAVTKKYRHLAPHNVLHTDNPELEFHEIFKKRLPPQNPTISLTVGNRIEPGRAPEGCDSWTIFTLAPATRRSFDWNTSAEAYTERILHILENRGFPRLRNHIAAGHLITPMDLRRRYNCYAGGLHGFASHSFRASFDRMKVDPNELPGFHFVGSSAHPGSGIPFVLSSARIAAMKILAGE